MYGTLDDYKTYMGVNVATNDALITRLANAAQAAIEQYTGRIFNAPLTTQLYYAEDFRGGRLVFDTELVSITAVVNGDGIPVLLDDVTTYPRRGTHIRELELSAGSWDTTDAVAVTGYFGHSVTPPADVLQAAIRQVTNWYRSKDATQQEMIQLQGDVSIPVNRGLSKDIQIILQPYVRFV